MKGIMVQGTGSGVGKTVIVAALCRYFSRKGYRVTPFKAQNMALNSYITKEGAEIGRAQALQAMAAGVEPTWAMNPVLLKASGPLGTQVILKGRPVGTMKPQEYYAFRQKAWQAVLEGWEALSREFDIAIVEGAGSPAEINLRDVEIVNMAVAKEFSLPVILVGDIDRGGVFASLYGTLALLEEDARYIKALLINKFRGDVQILRPGIKEIENKTGRPVIGVVPYTDTLLLEEEDSFGIYKQKTGTGQTLKVTVLKLPLISNFTDFLPLMYEDDIDLVFSLKREDILQADLVIIPGTKSTIRDLEFLKSHGIDETLKEAISRG
ncbi:MAG: cobyric acid synthase, partial [Nitrospirae bacterium]